MMEGQKTAFNSPNTSLLAENCRKYECDYQLLGKLW